MTMSVSAPSVAWLDRNCLWVMADALSGGQTDRYRSDRPRQAPSRSPRGEGPRSRPSASATSDGKHSCCCSPFQLLQGQRRRNPPSEACLDVHPPPNGALHREPPRWGDAPQAAWELAGCRAGQNQVTRVTARPRPSVRDGGGGRLKKRVGLAPGGDATPRASRLQPRRGGAGRGGRDSAERH
jgi:hypothetical protein